MSESAKSVKITKLSLAVAIFNQQLALRAAGTYATNREFRKATVAQIMDLGVSLGSASTMYNTAKKAAEAAAQAEGTDLGLGRDPKKQRPVSTGKRGRPTKTVAVPGAQAEQAEQGQSAETQAA